MESRNDHCWIIWNSANIISFSRFLIPVILFATDWGIKTKLICYLILAATDAFDGMIARAIGNKNGVGKFIDASTDKVMYGSGLLFLFTEGLVEFWIAVLVILGEIFLVSIVGYGIYVFAKREVKKSQPLFLSGLYQNVREEMLKNWNLSAFSKLKGISYGIGASFLLINVFWPSKLLEMGYYSVFISGIVFCAAASIEYYKKFNKWIENLKN